MKILTSTTGSRGFTLIELLIVLLIIGITASFATLGLNNLRPSEAQTLVKQIQNQIHQSQQSAQLKNINLRLVIRNNQSAIEQLNPLTQEWLEASDTIVLKWQDIVVDSSESVINISPNGYTTPSILEISADNESYQLKTQ
jgi:prepilin-type N-terminal cleavage/methylation domain-containing protein